MWLIDSICEQRIQEAMQKGEFDDLPGQGEPLDLQDDSLVPEELRAAYRLLKNAGYVPPEIELRKQIESVEALLRHTQVPEERSAAAKRLDLLLTRLQGCRGRQSVAVAQDYYDRLVHRLGRADDSKDPI